MTKAEIDELLERLDQHSSSWLTAKPVAALIRELIAERDAALAAAVAVQEAAAHLQEKEAEGLNMASLLPCDGGTARNLRRQAEDCMDRATAIRSLQLDHLATGRALLDAKDAEIAALGQDAKRYRWLRADHDPKPLFASLQEVHGEFWGALSMMLAEEELDAVIDAAIADKEPT